MRIGLIQPPSPFLIDPAVHGPLGLWYLGAALRLAGHEPVYADLGLGDALPEGCDAWALTGTTSQRDAMVDIVSQGVGAGVPVIVGGPHASAAPDDVLEMGATAVIVGEGDEVLPDLLGQPLTGHRVIVAPRIKNLDALPFPDRSQAHRYHYTVYARDGRQYDATTAITSRGCPHRCALCSAAVWKRRYTQRSAENVLAEVRGLRDRYDAIHFYDDSLAIDRRRLPLLCDGLGKLGVTWRCFVRGDQMNKERLQTMARGGCVEIGLGVESGSQAVLDAIDKDETVEQQADCIRWAHDAGIRVKAFLIVGLPGESRETIAETEAFLRRNQPDDIDVSLLQIYPGAPLYDDPRGLVIEATGGWYKGRPGQYEAHHRTAALSAQELYDAREYLEARYKPVYA